MYIHIYIYVDKLSKEKDLLLRQSLNLGEGSNFNYGGIYGHPKEIYPRSHACSANVNQEGSEGGAMKHKDNDGSQSY